ncbi:MAG: hypothetical protein M1821_008638 [Bathelium mastoideum]|nr:MAG: hypothetical protein M1821_008638 [Bathelium mastoideum]KAI9687236.1 MAG: hypothetical protein M1822_002279 [Bathelium mastoideum]
MPKREAATKAEPDGPKPKAARTAAAKPTYTPLAVDEQAAIAIRASYANKSPKAVIVPKTEEYGFDMQIRSSRGFVIVSTVSLTEGKYAGHCAILFKEDAPFRFMELPCEVRNRIQKMVVLPGETLQLKTKTVKRATVTATGYSAKNKLALLRVDKLNYAEAMQIVYSRATFSADTTNTLVKFLLDIGPTARNYLKDLYIASYVRKDVTMVFTLLGECKNLTRLHLADYPVNGTPAKVARAFAIEAGGWLSSRVIKSGKDEAVKPLKFGPQALKNGNKAFSKNEVAQFYGELDKKI